MRGIAKASPARPTSSAVLAGLRMRFAVSAVVLGVPALTLTPPAQAAPVHPPNEARDIAGLNHACGVATDSNGDVYLSSAGESKIEVYDPSHTELTSIEDTNEPCGLAVDSRGELLVSDQATGEVVRYVPNAYPFSGAPSYGSAEPVGEGGKKAKGISIDPFDNRLYVAEGTRVTSYGSEVQQFEIREATGGTYKLKFKGEETASLPFNASNAEVQAALESLPALGTGSVAVSGTSSATAWPHRIAFVGSAGFADVGRVEALPSLAGNEVDKLTVEATAGTYKLKFEGEETAAIEFNASASGAGSVQEALVALPTLAPGDVSVTGGPGDAGGTSPYVVAFEGASAGRNVGFLSPVTAALIGTASVSSKDGAETRYLAKATSGGRGFDEIQLLNVAKATAGTYKLKFKGEETASLPFNASAAEVQAALEALAAIAPGDVSVFLERSPTFSSRPYVLVFGGALASADVPQVEAVSSLLPNPGAEAGSSTEVGGWSGRVGEGTLTEASGVASYTVEPTQAIPSAPGTDRYLSVADAGGLAADQLYLFGGQDLRTLKLRRKINGAATPDGSFGFGAAGAYLAADPGNINRETKKCPEQKQACTAGHLFLYDAAHEALDEFDASGEYLGQTKNAAFADAKPTAVAIDRSGGAGDGTIYVTAGAGGEALAFEPLLAPKRETLEKPLSHELAKAGEVATDSHGDLYAVAGTFVHVYKPDGGEILTEGKPLIEDKLAPQDIAVDSTGKVYVLDGEKEVTYYTPSAYPPVAGTTYSRHLTPVATVKEFPNADEFLRAIAVNPGPGPGKDRLFVATHEYDSAANGSTLLDSEFAKGLVGHVRESIAVNGASGTVYFSVNPHLVIGVDPLGKEIVARIDTRVSQNGQSGSNPYLAVDQANGHVLEFDGVSSVVHEYDAAGSFVAQFGTFTEKISRPTRVAVDSACAVHEPPLTGAACESFDPANGNAYVAFDGSNPFDVTAFGPLRYGSAKAKFKLTVTKSGTGTGTVTSTPAGISCGATCSAEFEEGKEVELKAEAASGSEFVKWSGACAGSGTCKVTMSAAKEVTAEFKLLAKAKFKLTVTKSGTGTGTVTSTPAGISCGATCSAEFEEGKEVELKAEAAAGSEFVKWGGACAGTGTCKVTMSAAKEVTAEFKLLAKAKFKLTVTKSGTGTGTVTSTPAGISCGATCSAEFEEGKEVELKAEAAAGSEFVKWGGACAGTGTCKVTMSAAKEVTAEFKLLAKAKFKLTVTKSGTGTGTVTSTPAGISCGATCSAEFEEGKEVELKAEAAAGSEFVKWSGACAGSGTCKVTMSAAKEVTAEFKLLAKAKFKLTVTKSGTGTGTVTSTPAGISCGATCSAEFEEGKEVELKAEAAAGSEFVKWGGACAGTGTCKVTMSAAKEVTAEFKLLAKAKFKLTVTKSGTGTGTVTSTPAGISCGATCSAEFEEGKEVELKAEAAAGSEFVKWSGACAGSGTCKVTMSAAKEVTAEFKLLAKAKFKLTVTKSGTGTGTVTSTPAGISCGATCSAEFEEGKEVELKAEAAAGSEFVKWGGACAGTGTCKVTMSAAKSVQAIFKTIPIRKLRVIKSGSGSGTVTSLAPIADIDCGLACEAELQAGTEVELTANPDPGSAFFRWSGACTGTGTCKVTMSSAKTVHATFKATPSFTLSVTKSGVGNVTSSPPGIECGTQCAHEYASPTTVALSAVAAHNYRFNGWSGCESAAGPTCTVTMSSARAVSVSFVLTKCRKGFRRKKINGKPRCVKAKRHTAHGRKSRRNNANASRIAGWLGREF